MARKTTLDKDHRRAILKARAMIEELAKADGNEAETRRRVERIFESVMGYDAFKHLSREHAIRGSGETEHVDFAVRTADEKDAAPQMVVELKRVGIDLSKKHLKQVSSYAIDSGCEWIVLTNGREWELYHVTFGKPPETKLLHQWNILVDDPLVLAERFKLISYKSVRKGALDKLWRKRNVLQPRNLLEAILGESSVKLLRREIKKSSGVSVTLEDVIGGVRRLLNEAALTEMETMRITFPERKRRKRTSASVKVAQTKTETEEHRASA